MIDDQKKVFLLPDSNHLISPVIKKGTDGNHLRPIPEKKFI